MKVGYPRIETDLSEILIVKASDPILMRSHAEVSNDYFVSQISPVQLVAGSHGSGKTAYSLNLVRLCILAYLGCPLPAKYASVPLFNKIIVKMKKDDDLESLRSSFGNEIVQISNCLESIKNGGDKKLVIVDNFCTSSSHEDAWAHLLAFTTILLQKKCLALINTNDHNQLSLTNKFSSVSCLYMQTTIEMGKPKHTFKAILADPETLSSLYSFQGSLISQLSTTPLIKKILLSNFSLMSTHSESLTFDASYQNLIDFINLTKDYRTIILFDRSNTSKLSEIIKIIAEATNLL